MARFSDHFTQRNFSLPGRRLPASGLPRNLLASAERGESHSAMSRTDLHLGSTSFCVLDIETTGLSAHQHEITEIAAIRVREGFEIEEEFQCLVRIGGRVPWHITQITGIDDRMLRAQGRELPEVLKQVHEFSCGRLAFAHNARFDRSFLNAAAQRLGWQDEFALECSIPVFKRLLPNRRGYGLGAVADCLRVRSGVAHRALADCRMLLDCLKRAHG